MSIAKIQKGDKVKVISGNFKNSIGIVNKVVSITKRSGAKTKRVAIDSLPKIADFKKSYTYQGTKYPGSISEKFRMVDISNVQLLDENNKLSRVKITINDNKKTRLYKTTSQPVVKNKVEDSKTSLENK
jgi:ribosomal protein L24